ncbi:MAG: sugar kinase [Chloroflexota bacterium]
MAKVVTVGVHILDVLGRHVERIPEGQGIDLIEEIRLTVAGTAAGSAVDLAKLGADVTSIGAIGHDDAGNFIVDTMNRYGINTDYLVRKDGVQTSATMLPIRPNGERPAMHVLGTNAEFSIEDIDRDVIKAADYVHFGGTYLLPKMDGAPTAEILQFAQEHGAVTSLDMLAVPGDDMIGTLAPSLPHLDFLIPGIEEAAMIAGIPEENIDELIDYYLDKGVKHLIFTMGGDGSIIASRELDTPIRIPAFNVPVVDSTGCGDAYCAGFIVGLTHGWDLEKCGLFASAASGLVITGLGSDAGIVNFDETLKMMETHERHPIG